MTKVKYFYDYPANRAVAKNLLPGDRSQIAFRTGYSVNYVREWCRGTRKNKRIEEYVRKFAALNIARERKLKNITDTSTN